MSTDSLKIQFHPKLGTVIYDPIAQIGVAPDQVRLFKINSMSANTFLRTIVNKDLTPCAQEMMSEHGKAVATYRAARSSRRKPYCEQCRRHYGSVDFGVCADCSGIRCTCGSCSCVATSRRKRAA